MGRSEESDLRFERVDFAQNLAQVSATALFVSPSHLSNRGEVHRAAAAVASTLVLLRHAVGRRAAVAIATALELIRRTVGHRAAAAVASTLVLLQGGSCNGVVVVECSGGGRGDGDGSLLVACGGGDLLGCGGGGGDGGGDGGDGGGEGGGEGGGGDDGGGGGDGGGGSDDGGGGGSGEGGSGGGRGGGGDGGGGGGWTRGRFDGYSALDQREEIMTSRPEKVVLKGQRRPPSGIGGAPSGIVGSPCGSGGVPSGIGRAITGIGGPLSGIGVEAGRQLSPAEAVGVELLHEGGDLVVLVEARQHLLGEQSLWCKKSKKSC